MKTSVIIATRNSEATIDECLSSLVPYYEQGYIGEIIVVDGCSADRTIEIAQKYPVKIMTDPGKGMFVGYEAAWRETSGEFVMFLDSDAFLEAGFFHAATRFFADDSVGIAGYMARASADNALGKTIGQWWDYHGIRLKTTGKNPSWFKRRYHNATGFSGGETYTSGPCYIARRKCLEAAGGFKLWLHLYEASPRLMYPGDSLLSRRIVEMGWKAAWWTEAPLRHHPPASFKKFMRQRYEWGKGDAVVLRLTHRRRLNRIAPPLTRLGAPLLGAWLAMIYRNPAHLLYFPLAQFAWLAGYLASPKIAQIKRRELTEDALPNNRAESHHVRA